MTSTVQNMFEKLIHYRTSVFVFLYLATRLVNINALPVFADEAIYIRWAQVAFNEPSKYLFLPMLDGKPPLHVWMLIPFAKFFTDPLVGGRVLSVLAGLATLFVIKKLIKLLGGKDKEELFGMFFVVFAPYWFLFHRMALAESLMNLWLSLVLLFSVEFFQKQKKKSLLLLSLSLAAALWTKTNALFFYPVLALFPVLLPWIQKEAFCLKSFFSKRAYWFYGALIFGMALFVVLKFHPLFPMLFKRSADYSFSVSELIQKEWRYVLFTSIPKVIVWFVWYLTPFVFLLFPFARKKALVFGLCALVYSAPIVLVGKVPTSRYFYPILVFLTPIFVFAVEPALRSKTFGAVMKKLFYLFTFTSVAFVFFSLTNPKNIPFTLEDKVQYLTEWSSGYGIPEAVNFFKEKAKTEKVVVATEGFFGTLPDGLQIYFDKKQYEGKVEIHGVGQPITEVPQAFRERAKHEQVYMLVNEHRFFDANSDHYEVLNAFPRPLGGPRLLLLKVKGNK